MSKRTMAARGIVIALAASSLLAGCGSGSSPSSTRPTPVSPTARVPAPPPQATAPTTAPTTAAGPPASRPLAAGVADRSVVPAGCTLVGTSPWTRPDPRCTPGSLNPAVTPQTIGSTICVPGYSTRIRPPESFTYGLKRSQMAAWGLSGSTSQTEEDHLVPLSLGGAPSDSMNLWPEPGGIPNPKDRLEYRLYRMVCDHEIDLRTAQQAIAVDWISAYRRYLGPTS